MPARVSQTMPARLEWLTVDAKGIGAAYFANLFNRYSPVAQNEYGYEFSFQIPSGALISFPGVQVPTTTSVGRMPLRRARTIPGDPAPRAE